MKLSVPKIVDKLIWFLTVFILVTYLVFEMYAWGRYAYLGASLGIMLLSAYRHMGRIRIRVVPYYGFMLLFIGFTALSSLWALNMSDAISKALTLTLILLCNIMVYVHYQYEENVEKLLRAVMWAGYIVAIYAILFYGFDTIMLATEGAQVGNEFSNINTIGMTVAVACVIQVHEWLYKNSRKSIIFMVPCILVIAATQSRKSLVLLGLGIFLVSFLKYRESKDLMSKLGKLLLLSAAAVGVMAALYTLPVFDGIRIRMDRMIAAFLGQAGADNSTIVRRNMTALGWEWFLKYPIGGIGIGNPHILAGRYLTRDTYLHNNYVELLCGGGIVGFAAYYGMYVYLFVRLFRYRQADQKHFEIGFVWLILMVIMDYGMVSYYSKDHWFYLMIHFLNIASMKRTDRGMRNAHK